MYFERISEGKMKTKRASKMEMVQILFCCTAAERDGMTCPRLKYVYFKEDEVKERKQ